jgi:hypothetical protein
VFSHPETLPTPYAAAVLDVTELRSWLERTSVDAAWVGWGAQNEHRLIAEACEAAGVTFGPDASALPASSDPAALERRMTAAGLAMARGWVAVPTVPRRPPSRCSCSWTSGARPGPSGSSCTRCMAGAQGLAESSEQGPRRIVDRVASAAHPTIGARRRSTARPIGGRSPGSVEEAQPGTCAGSSLGAGRGAPRWWRR